MAAKNQKSELKVLSTEEYDGLIEEMEIISKTFADRTNAIIRGIQPATEQAAMRKELRAWVGGLESDSARVVVYLKQARKAYEVVETKGKGKAKDDKAEAESTDEAEAVTDSDEAPEAEKAEAKPAAKKSNGRKRGGRKAAAKTEEVPA